jgi:uncharacterized protein GlcG (DUF336 family)
MYDATIFSIDVAVAKARNDAYYSNPTSNLTPSEQVSLTDGSGNPVTDKALAFTSRTFRFLANPYIPEGIQGSPPGPWSILNDPGVNPANGYNYNNGGTVPVASNTIPSTNFTSVLGYSSFHPDANFQESANTLNQNGIVYFPGSLPLYQGSSLIGGLGVSGDGVNQDDVVTSYAGVAFTPPTAKQADQFFVSGNVRLPYQEYSRNANQL